jgi:hypothetical protein
MKAITLGKSKPLFSHKDKDYFEYDVNCAIEDIAEAKEMMADEELMGKLAPFAKKKIKALRSFDDMRAKAEELEKEEPEESDD